MGASFSIHRKWKEREEKDMNDYKELYPTPEELVNKMLDGVSELILTMLRRYWNHQQEREISYRGLKAMQNIRILTSTAWKLTKICATA